MSGLLFLFVPMLSMVGIRKFNKIMVGPNGLEPSTSSVSRKRSNQTELRAYNVRILANTEDFQVVGYSKMARH